MKQFELSIEEKAKRYDEAIEKAKKLQHDNAWVTSIFPELKKNEDDRIRKELIAIFKGEIPFTSKEDAKRYIVWLEKQGEKKEILCDKCRREQPSHSCQDIAELGRCALEHKSKQKPAWSEEDTRTLNFLIECVECCSKGKSMSMTYSTALKYLDWLKSLKPQPKQEWSKEDEAAYNKALDAYYYKDCNDKDDVVFALKELIDLIAKHRKTIPPYQRWKPTKEQMDALKRAHNRYDICNICGIGVLESLYKDLEKLM